MKQLFQNRQDGSVEVAELPAPAVKPGTVLVRTVCSAISPGTERASVSAARQSMVKTARERPDLVRRVMDMAQRDGFMSTVEKVRLKLSEPMALGYSSAGEIIEIGPECGDTFRVGDRVACAGQGYASHAEQVCVPVNLVALVPGSVSFEQASFATLGAIALHGVRQGSPTLGERFAVIGLGVIGQLAVQILVANGVRVAAFDLDAELVDRARAMGAELGVAGPGASQVAAAIAWTGGLGVDAVVVTASSSDDGPMVAAGRMCRDRGRVVLVGGVPFGLPRELAYEKELELKIARSYGPGRYDSGFEEKGIDYPVGHVRWTETRNLEAILHLMSTGAVNLDPLITHRYALAEAPAAYDQLLSGKGPRPVGMVIHHGTLPPVVGSEPRRAVAALASTDAPCPRPISGKVGVGFIGAGSFARTVLLPAFKASKDAQMRRVATAHGLTAMDAQKKFGFRNMGTDGADLLRDATVDLVCIATRHDDHGEWVMKALGAGKHVFVEKPLCIREAELEAIGKVAATQPGLLMVGFNRRFSPMARAIRQAVVHAGPVLVTCRVNGGLLPASSWALDPEVGGGRIIGEACHFVDLVSFLAGDAPITSVHAECLGRPSRRTEDVCVTLSFADGSVGQVVYTARGHAGLGKERVEVFAGGVSGVIDDFKEATIFSGSRTTRVKDGGKGHHAEVEALLRAVKAGGPAPIPLETILAVTRATFGIHRSLAEGRSVVP